MDKERIRAGADTVLRDAGRVFEVPVRIAAIAEMLGFFVGQAKLTAGTEGIIAVDRTKKELLGVGRNMVIIVDRRLDDARKRFIIAHELGHYLLRPDRDGPVFERSERWESFLHRSAEEEDADYFAACLLMPHNSYSEALRLLGPCDRPTANGRYRAAAILSEQFRVPQLAALRRIDEVLVNEIS